MKKSMFAAFLLMTLAMTLAMTSIPSVTQATTESTFVAVVGAVEFYGDKPAYGFLRAFAEINKCAEVGVFWTLGPVHIACLPYNYSFYVARLNVTKMVELNYTGKDFYVSGLWDVYNITFYYGKDGNFTWTIKLIVDDGFGELNVINKWTAFTVDIEGIKQIAGIVLRYYIRSFKIPRGDCNWDGIVDIYDLVHIAQAYGNTPGIGKYYFDVDLTTLTNLDFVIDIYDLTTVAASLGESY